MRRCYQKSIATRGDTQLGFNIRVSETGQWGNGVMGLLGLGAGIICLTFMEETAHKRRHHPLYCLRFVLSVVYFIVSGQFFFCHNLNITSVYLCCFFQMLLCLEKVSQPLQLSICLRSYVSEEYSSWQSHLGKIKVNTLCYFPPVLVPKLNSFRVPSIFFAFASFSDSGAMALFFNHISLTLYILHGPKHF